MTTLYDFSARTLAGEEKSLSDYAGRVVLVVNTASKCGLTRSSLSSKSSTSGMPTRD